MKILKPKFVFITTFHIFTNTGVPKEKDDY